MPQGKTVTNPPKKKLPMPMTAHEKEFVSRMKKDSAYSGFSEAQLKKFKKESTQKHRVDVSRIPKP